MDNSQRRVALREARTNAVSWAREAEEAYRTGESAQRVNQKLLMADTWANVAQALKIGSEYADSAEGY